MYKFSRNWKICLAYNKYLLYDSHTTVNVLKTNSTINVMILVFLFIHKLNMITTQSPFNKLQNMGKTYQEKKKPSI